MNIILDTRTAAYLRSLHAQRNIGGENFFFSLEDHLTAEAVASEAVLREREFDRLHTPKPVAEKRTPSQLGCWVDGVLRFQSRNHDAVREYAARQMRPRTQRLSDGSYRVITANVWVAPVGSFVAE